MRNGRVVFIFYNSRYGYPVQDITLQAVANPMTGDLYKNTVSQASKMIRNPVTKGLLTTQKAGEKLLRALLITLKDGAHTAGQWIDAKAQKDDTKKS